MKLSVGFLTLLLAGCVTQPDYSEDRLKALLWEVEKQGILKSYQSEFPGISEVEVWQRLAAMEGSKATYECLQKQDGYAGVVTVNKDVFEIRAYFKGDAGTALSNCTGDPIYRAISTSLSLEGLKSQRDKLGASLTTIGIQHVINVVPYGHMDNYTPPYPKGFVTLDGYVEVIVEPIDTQKTERLIQELNMQNVYVVADMNEGFDVVIPTSDKD